MPSELLKTGFIVDEVTIDGETFTVPVRYQIIKATPDSGGLESRILMLTSEAVGRGWRWDAPVGDWTAEVDDPDSDQRWVQCDT